MEAGSQWSFFLWTEWWKTRQLTVTVMVMVMAGVEGAFFSCPSESENLNPSPVSSCIRPEMSIGNLARRFHIPFTFVIEKPWRLRGKCTRGKSQQLIAGNKLKCLNWTTYVLWQAAHAASNSIKIQPVGWIFIVSCDLKGNSWLPISTSLIVLPISASLIALQKSNLEFFLSTFKKKNSKVTHLREY